LAAALRRGPYQTNLLIAGCDLDGSFTLYTLDYLASMAKVNYGAQGYASNFVLSIFDREWKPDLNMEEGIEIIKKCLHELKTRFLISQPNFLIKVVDKAGIRTITL
jgi:20S proteasome subunit beta 4